MRQQFPFGWGALALALGAASCGVWPFQPSGQELDPRTVQRGRQVYVQNCAVCHGPNAEGAQNWQQLDERGNRRSPPHDDTGHTWRHPDSQLKEIILDGWRDPFNKTEDLTMPGWRGKLSDEEIDAVIVYFKSLWSEEHRAFQREQARGGEMGPG